LVMGVRAARVRMGLPEEGAPHACLTQARRDVRYAEARAE